MIEHAMASLLVEYQEILVQYEEGDYDNAMSTFYAAVRRAQKKCPALTCLVTEEIAPLSLYGHLSDEAGVAAARERIEWLKENQFK